MRAYGTLEVTMGETVVLAAAPVLSTTALIAAGGRAFNHYGRVGGLGRPGTPANDDEAPKPDAEGTAAE